LLRHFPREVGEAFERLRTTGDAAALEQVIHAVVEDHIPAPAKAAAPALTPGTALIDDLGFDSMAISELVFFFEDLFRVSIANDEIVRVRTVGELCAFVGTKLAAARKSAG
jgi:acyl carrier protein